MLRSINKKNKLYYKYKISKFRSSHAKYTIYRNTLTSILSAAKKQYFFAQFQATHDMKLNIDGNIVDDPHVIVDIFNEYLSRIIPESHKQFNLL